jgi:uncharacterized protein
MCIPRLLYDSEWSFPVQGQCDCACAGAVNPPRLTLTPFDHTTLCMPSQSLPIYSLPPTHQVALSPHGVVVLNQPAYQLLTAFNGGRTPQDVLAHLPADWPAEAAHTTLQEMGTLGLLSLLDAQPQVPPETPTTLNAWLHITNSCNLNCAYCYVPKTDESMSLEVGQRAIDAVFRSAARHGFQRVKLKYAGGEPTLRFDLVEQLHAYARAQAEALGLELEAVILSNGVALNDQMLETLLTQNIRLSISLDGLNGAHDAQRPLLNGRGSAHLVRRTIERVLELGLRPDVTVTITNRNLDALPSVVAWLAEHDIPFNLNFYRENDVSASHTDLRLQDERLIAAMRRAFAVIEVQLPRRSLFGSLLDRVQFVAPHHYPCAAARNYLVIDHHGRIAQCQMTMGQPVADIWADDPLTAVLSALGGIPGLSVEEREGCAKCKWRYWCAGGCPLETFRATGRYDVRSPHCAIYQALIPEVLRLEALRILKYGVDRDTE